MEELLIQVGKVGSVCAVLVCFIYYNIKQIDKKDKIIESKDNEIKELNSELRDINKDTLELYSKVSITLNELIGDSLSKQKDIINEIKQLKEFIDLKFTARK